MTRRYMQFLVFKIAESRGGHAMCVAIPVFWCCTFSWLRGLQACKNVVHLSTKQPDEIVEKLHFHALGAELNVFTQEHIICVSRLKDL